jgi:hypothetical protein
MYLPLFYSLYLHIWKTLVPRRIEPRLYTCWHIAHLGYRLLEQIHFQLNLALHGEMPKSWGVRMRCRHKKHRLSLFWKLWTCYSPLSLNRMCLAYKFALVHQWHRTLARHCVPYAKLTGAGAPASRPRISPAPIVVSVSVMSDNSPQLQPEASQFIRQPSGSRP